MPQGMRDFGNALVVALISIGLMLGALSISLVEFVPEATPTSTSVLLASPAPLTATSTLPPTIAGLETSTPTITLTSVNTSTPPSSCQPPFGWVSQINIQPGDTLDILAARYNISKDELMRANCLVSSTLVAGTKLYIPPITANTPVTCTPGAAGWIKNYAVKPGDTIYAIATNHYTTAGLLKSVNCRSSDLIYPNETLWVPNVATRTPYPTPLPGVTVTPQPTDPLTETALPYTATIIPTSTSIPATLTPVPTSTPIPTSTPSPTSFPQ